VPCPHLEILIPPLVVPVPPERRANELQYLLERESIMSRPTTAMTSSAHNCRRPHIILGITGSIAAVKGPRLALRLANKLKAHVKVVLTRTVEQYFWKEGRAVPTYDVQSWIDFERTLVTSRARDEEEEYETDWKLTSGRISIHCEYLNCVQLRLILLSLTYHHHSVHNRRRRGVERLQIIE